LLLFVLIKYLILTSDDISIVCGRVEENIYASEFETKKNNITIIYYCIPGIMKYNALLRKTKNMANGSDRRTAECRSRYRSTYVMERWTQAKLFLKTYPNRSRHWFLRGKNLVLFMLHTINTRKTGYPRQCSGDP